jgi:hypothetical protein
MILSSTINKNQVKNRIVKIYINLYRKIILFRNTKQNTYKEIQHFFNETIIYL